jgi:hypothetical protein
MDDTGLLIKRVDALIGSSPDAEDMLMDGYAHALELEAERVRLERRFSELAHTLGQERGSERLPELRSLKQRISKTEEQLARLRTVLTAARRRLVAATAAESA